LNQSGYRKLIATEGGGFAQKLLRRFLQIVSVFYSGGVALRNLLYDRGWLRIRNADVPVISVGNITVGGTGKTPIVIRLADLLKQKNIPCAILTRGYKTGQGKFVDEPAILAKACPDARVVINADRFAGAGKAAAEFGAKALIMDDGFQHRKLARQLDIVAIDAMCPFGYNKLLPAGLLREPITALKRADAVVITRCNQTPGPRLEQLEKKLQMINPEITIAKSVHTPVCARMLKNKEISLDELKGKKIFAFCGIGNPEAFFDSLGELGVTIVGSKSYNDHHQYTKADIDDIFEEATYLNAELGLTTQKDWVKTALLGSQKTDFPFAYLAIKLEFIEGEDKIVGLIEEVLRDSRSGSVN